MKNRVGMAWAEFMTISVTTFNIESMGFAMLKGPIYGQPILGQCITTDAYTFACSVQRF